MSSSSKSLYDKAHFGMIRIVHETLYSVFVNPYDMLRASGLTAGQKVLEVGCGPGFFTIPASELVGKSGYVYALDNNPVAVDYVKRKVLLQGVKNVDVVTGDARCMEMPSEFFDTVFLYGVVHALWGDMDRVVAEACRTLKAHGILSISKSRLPETGMIDEVTRNGTFRLAQRGDRVMNFEKQLP